jgi:hypothetical protein
VESSLNRLNFRDLVWTAPHGFSSDPAASHASQQRLNLPVFGGDFHGFLLDYSELSCSDTSKRRSLNLGPFFCDFAEAAQEKGFVRGGASGAVDFQAGEFWEAASGYLPGQEAATCRLRNNRLYLVLKTVHKGGLKNGTSLCPRLGQHQ